MFAAGLRVLRLPPIDRRRIVEAGAQLVRASFELRFLPSARTTSLLGAVHTEDRAVPVGAAQLHEAMRVGSAVTRAAHRLPGSHTCLPQALAVQRMLRRRGIPSRLHLGVTRPSVGEAHAWVTVNGHPVVGGAGIERYVPLAEFR